MPAAISLTVKKQVIQDVKEGLRDIQISAKRNIGRDTVSRIRHELEDDDAIVRQPAGRLSDEDVETWHRYQRLMPILGYLEGQLRSVPCCECNIPVLFMIGTVRVICPYCTADLTVPYEALRPAKLAELRRECGIPEPNHGGQVVQFPVGARRTAEIDRAEPQPQASSARARRR